MILCNSVKYLNGHFKQNILEKIIVHQSLPRKVYHQPNTDSLLGNLLYTAIFLPGHPKIFRCLFFQYLAIQYKDLLLNLYHDILSSLDSNIIFGKAGSIGLVSIWRQSFLFTPTVSSSYQPFYKIYQISCNVSECVSVSLPPPPPSSVCVPPLYCSVSLVVIHNTSASVCCWNKLSFVGTVGWEDFFIGLSWEILLSINLTTNINQDSEMQKPTNVPTMLV